MLLQSDGRQNLAEPSRIRGLGFFFQAEDGIRVIGVTGVQTCALPISTSSARDRGKAFTMRISMRRVKGLYRSEERRVGKECRCRWPPEREPNKASPMVEMPYATQRPRLAGPITASSAQPRSVSHTTAA